VDGGTAPTGYTNVPYWYDTLHCVASSLTLESDDAGSGKGHNFYTSVVVRSEFPQKFEGAFVGLQTRENQNISGSDVRNTYTYY